jgi:hypothetical protein
MATILLPVPRALGIGQILSPGFQIRSQMVEIEVRKRGVRAVQISQGTLQNRARTHEVSSGLVIKSDGQLHHPLDMQAELPVRRRVPGQGAPDVLENLVRVEKVAAVEQGHTAPEQVSLHVMSFTREPSLAAREFAIPQ